VLGILGVFMRRFGWSRPAFLIGFVLAAMSERYLYQAVQFYGWGFLVRPIVVAIAVLTLVSLWLSARGRKLVGDTLETEGDPAKAHASQMWPQIAFSLAMMGLFAFTFSEAWPKSFLGGIFPLVVAIAGAIFTGIVLVSQFRGPDTGANFDAEATPRAERDPGPWYYLAWLAGFIGVVALIGFFSSLILFFVSFLRLEAGSSWLRTLALTAGAALFVLILADALNLVFPGGVLQAYVDLPWPFR
jgi:putative tricarboxylic transport membrane protein